MKPVISRFTKTGDLFSRLTVDGVFSDGQRHFARVLCECGSPAKYVRLDALRNGVTKSCGCLQKESVTKHGYWGRPLFGVWRAMISRCTNQNDKRFARYGGRGIAVCDRWHDVNNFVSDMTEGYETGLQLDRINNDGLYDPSNCKWSTTKQQTRNYSRNVLLQHDGRTMCAIDWSVETGIPVKVIYGRVSEGWSDKDALTKPPDSRVRR